MKKRATASLMLVIAGLSLNAHALCVNPDGSLDDKSVPPGSIAVEMLPVCQNAAPATVAVDATRARSVNTKIVQPENAALKTKMVN